MRITYWRFKVRYEMTSPRLRYYKIAKKPNLLVRITPHRQTKPISVALLVRAQVGAIVEDWCLIGQEALARHEQLHVPPLLTLCSCCRSTTPTTRKQKNTLGSIFCVYLIIKTGTNMQSWKNDDHQCTSRRSATHLATSHYMRQLAEYNFSWTASYTIKTHTHTNSDGKRYRIESWDQ